MACYSHFVVHDVDDFRLFWPAEVTSSLSMADDDVAMTSRLAPASKRASTYSNDDNRERSALNDRSRQTVRIDQSLEQGYLGLFDTSTVVNRTPLGRRLRPTLID